MAFNSRQPRNRSNERPRSSRNSSSYRSTPSNHGRNIVVVILTLLLLFIGWLISFALRKTSFPIIDIGTQTPSPTVTATPFPIVDVEVARRQTLAALQRWTDVQIVEIGCLVGVCNQRVHLSLTLLTHSLLTHTVTEELAGQPLDPAVLEARLQDLENRLQMQDRLVFVLTVTPDKQTLPVYNEITLGPLANRLVLRTTNGETYYPVTSDAVFDVPISLTESKSFKSYISFPNQGGDGKLLLETGLSLNLQLPISDDVQPKNSFALWSFDLVQNPDPPPLTPTPTVDPNQPTPTPSPWADPDVYITIIELLVELIGQTQSSP